MKALRGHVAFILFAAVGVSAMANSDVMESSSPYSCCENPAISFNHHCENVWYISNKPIAYYKGIDKSGCIHPCKKIETGQMMLDGCADVNTTMVCTNENNVAEETRIRHYGLLCSESRLAPVNQGSICLVLLAAVIGALFVGTIG